MRTAPRFASVAERAGHYESLYLKATRPGGGQGVWIRHTVHKRPGAEPSASLWLTLFDAAAEGPRAAKLTVPASGIAVPPGTLIEVAGARLEPGRARGAIETGALTASWDLRFGGEAPAFRHMPYGFLYEAPLPRTKFLSPYPDARFDGVLTVDGEELTLQGWPGMIGHNWGAEHAERWTWIQANDFGAEGDWFDAALGRVRVGPWTTPWIGNAMLRLDGREHRLGGFDRIRSTRIEDSPTCCEFGLEGEGISVSGRVAAPAKDFVAWVYADPVGPEHNTLNCSIADLELSVRRQGEPERTLRCAGAAAYEIGMRETDHGIPVQPYPDG